MVHIHGGQRGRTGVLLYHFPACSFETVSLPKPRARLEAGKTQLSTHLCLTCCPSTRVTECVHSLTRVLQGHSGDLNTIFTQSTLLLSHLPSSVTLIFFIDYLLSGLCSRWLHKPGNKGLHPMGWHPNTSPWGQRQMRRWRGLCWSLDCWKPFTL